MNCGGTHYVYFSDHTAKLWRDQLRFDQPLNCHLCSKGSIRPIIRDAEAFAPDTAQLSVNIESYLEQFNIWGRYVDFLRYRVNGLSGSLKCILDCTLGLIFDFWQSTIRWWRN
jgi:hypothetical protein